MHILLQYQYYLHQYIRYFCGSYPVKYLIRNHKELSTIIFRKGIYGTHLSYPNPQNKISPYGDLMSIRKFSILPLPKNNFYQHKCKYYRIICCKYIERIYGSPPFILFKHNIVLIYFIFREYAIISPSYETVCYYFHTMY